MTEKSIALYLQETKDRHGGFHKLGIGREVDETNVSVTSQDHELNLKKMASPLPVLLNFMRPHICQKCGQIKKSYSYNYKINFQEYMHLINAKKLISQNRDQPAEISFDSLHILHGTLALLGFAQETLPDKCVCKNVKQHKRIRIASDTSSFTSDSSDLEHLENGTGSPSKWAFDSVEKILRRKTLRKFPLLFESVPPDAIVEQASSLGHDKMSESMSSTSHTISGSPEMMNIPVGGQGSYTKVCHNRVLSSSSATSSSSYSGTCKECSPASALLYCVWDGNVPTFLFSVNDGSDEIFVARPMKIKCSIDRALDYIYIFHSLKVKRKRYLNHVSGASSFIGRMKVSSSLCLDSRRSKYMETQFVLFGAKDAHSSDNRNSPSNFTRGNGLSRLIAEIFKTSISSRHQNSHKVSASCQFENLQEMLRSELIDFDEIDKGNYYAHEFRSNDELAAVVVKDYGYEGSNHLALGGWGLKFLQKFKVCNDNSSDDHDEEFLASESSSKIVNVVVPAGYHGGPVTQSSGPSSIIERWKSPGHCDCGGWDAGCPITVLENNSNSNILANQNSSGDSTFELTIEGSKQHEPAVKLVNVRDNVYLTYFQSTLSALQCFSIAVAIIHSRTPALSPRL